MIINKIIMDDKLKKAQKDKEWTKTVTTEWLKKACKVSKDMYHRKCNSTVEEIALYSYRYFIYRIFFAKNEYSFWDPSFKREFEELTGITLNPKLTPITKPYPNMIVLEKMPNFVEVA
jgi:hypothetical protein